MSLDSLTICEFCGETPRIAPHYCSIAHVCKAEQDKSNKAARFFGYQKHVKETHGILGKGQRV